MDIIIEIILFGVGTGLGLWWFTVIVLPIFYGLPKSIFWTVKGKLKAKSSIVYVRTFFLWTVLFTFAAFLLLEFSPNTATYLYNSPGFSFGQLFGILGALIYAISKSGRHDLKEDFWAAMVKFQKQTSPNRPLQPTQDPRG